MNINNILVTGGFGILGRSLIKQLLKNKRNNIFLLDRSSNKKKISTLNIQNKKLKIIKGDFKNFGDIDDGTWPIIFDQFNEFFTQS